MGRTAETHDRILRELNEERLSALRRISQTLEGLIAEAEAAGESVRTSDATQRPAALAAYQDVRARALQYRWFLEVQREAMGLRHHHRLDEFYRVPPPMT